MEEHNGGELHTPEQGEDLRINTIVIPADDEQLLRQGEIGVARIESYQQLVGGYIEAVRLERPPASIYLNEEGKLNDLPVNRRATMLLWMHHPAFRYADYIAGDAFLVGPVDEIGNDTDVPDDFVQTLLEARSLRAEVQTHGDSSWHGNDLRFDDWTKAYVYALSLGQRWTSVEDVRVVPDE